MNALFVLYIGKHAFSHHFFFELLSNIITYLDINLKDESIATLKQKTFIYRKTCKFASLFFRAVINIFIHVIFSNILTYLDINLKDEKKLYKF